MIRVSSYCVTTGLITSSRAACEAGLSNIEVTSRAAWRETQLEGLFTMRDGCRSPPEPSPCGQGL